MKKIAILLLISFPIFSYSQNVGIGTTAPLEKLEVKNALRSTVRISSNSFNDTTELVLSNRNSGNSGTDFSLKSVREEGLFISSLSDLPGNNSSNSLVIRPNGNVGIGMIPAYKFQVNGQSRFNGITQIEGLNLLEFGAGIAGKEINAGKVGYNAFGQNALTFVGAGTNATNRAVYFFAEGGTTMNGPLDIEGPLKVNGNPGTAGQVLTSNGISAPSWTNAASGNGGNVGFGPWGDCSTNAISEYYPVADAIGQSDDYFGQSVSMSGNYAIVGAYRDDGVAGVNQGSASIYQWNGTSWVLMQKITDATGAADDYFGYSVSISGNYAIVGAHQDNGVAVNQGSASIYQWNGTNWVLMQKITNATGAADDFFGYSVSISGNFAIVGANQDDGVAGVDQGSASIYQWNGTNWVLMQKITDVAGAVGDNFGYSVSISGNYAIVGAYTDDGVAGPDQGSASIYQWNGANWILMQKITDATGATSDAFGNSVSISGIYAIVGAFLDDVGANPEQGSASIYQWNGSSWVLMQKITNAAGAAGDLFGNCVFISGNFAIVGANQDDGVAGVDQGSAGIYQRVGLGWQKLQYVTDPGGNSIEYFGKSAAIDEGNRRFIIGTSNYGSNSGKVVFGKIN